MIKVAATREKIASRPQLSKGIGRPSRQTKGIGFSDPQRETVAVSASKSKSEPICVSDLFPKLSPNEARANIPILSQQEKKEWKEKIKRAAEIRDLIKKEWEEGNKIDDKYGHRKTVSLEAELARLKEENSAKDSKKICELEHALLLVKWSGSEYAWLHLKPHSSDTTYEKFLRIIERIAPEAKEDEELVTLAACLCLKSPKYPKLNPHGFFESLPGGLINGKSDDKRVQTVVKYMFLELEGASSARDVEDFHGWNDKVRDFGLRTLVANYSVTKLIEKTFPTWLDGEDPVIRKWMLRTNSKWSGSSKKTLALATSASSWALRYGLKLVKEDGTYDVDTARKLNWKIAFDSKDIGLSSMLGLCEHTPITVSAIKLGQEELKKKGVVKKDLIGPNNDQLHLWEIVYENKWHGKEGLELIDQVTENIVERKPLPEKEEILGKGNNNLIVEGDNAKSAENIKKITNWKQLYDGEANGALFCLGIRAPDALKRKYPKLFGYGLDQIKPWETSYSGMWKGPKGKKLFKDAFVYSLIQAGLGSNNSGTKVTQEGFNLSCTKEEFIEWRDNYFKDKKWLQHFVGYGLSSGYRDIVHDNITKAFELWLGKLNSRTRCFGDSEISIDDIYPLRKDKVKASPLLGETTYSSHDVTFKCNSYNDSLQGPNRFYGTPLEYIFPDASFPYSIVYKYEEARKALLEASAVYLNAKKDKADVTALETIVSAKISNRALKVILQIVRDDILPNLSLAKEESLKLACKIDDIVKKGVDVREKLLCAINYKDKSTCLGLLDASLSYVFSTMGTCEKDIKEREHELADALKKQRNSHLLGTNRKDLSVGKKTIVSPLIDTVDGRGTKAREIAYTCHMDSHYLQGPYRLAGTPLEYIFPDSSYNLGVVRKYEEPRFTLWKIYNIFKSAKSKKDDLTPLEVIVQASSPQTLGVETFPFRGDEQRAIFKTVKDDIVPNLDIDNDLKRKLTELLEKLLLKACKREMVLKEAMKLCNPDLTYLGRPTLLGALNNIFEYVFLSIEKNEEAIRKNVEASSSVGEKLKTLALTPVSYMPQDVTFSSCTDRDNNHDLASTPLETIFGDQSASSEAIYRLKFKREALKSAYSLYKECKDSNGPEKDFTPLEVVTTSDFCLPERDLIYLLQTIRDDIVPRINLSDEDKLKLERLFVVLLRPGSNRRVILERAFNLTNRPDLDFFRTQTTTGLLNSILQNVFLVMEHNEAVINSSSNGNQSAELQLPESGKQPLRQDDTVFVRKLLTPVDFLASGGGIEVSDDCLSKITVSSDSLFYKMANAVAVSFDQGVSVSPFEAMLVVKDPSIRRNYLLTLPEIKEILTNLNSLLKTSSIAGISELTARASNPREVLISAINEQRLAQSSQATFITAFDQTFSALFDKAVLKVISERMSTAQVNSPGGNTEDRVKLKSIDPDKIKAARSIAQKIENDQTLASAYYDIYLIKQHFQIEAEIKLLRQNKSDRNSQSKADALEKLLLALKGQEKGIRLNVETATFSELCESVSDTARKLELVDFGNDDEVQTLVSLYLTKRRRINPGEPKGFLSALPDGLLVPKNERFLPRFVTLWKVLA